MNALDTKIDSLQKSVNKLLEENSSLREFVKNLESDLQSKSDNLQTERKCIHELKEEIKKLELVSAFSGNDEYKKSMKLQLNKLIKEIDHCILELKSF